MPTPRKSRKHATVDEYLAGVSLENRAMLQNVRNAIRAAAPRAEECISYDMPGFRLEGKWLIGFAAAARHCALYGVPKACEGDLRDFDLSGRGTVRFSASNPLPARLVAKIVKARLRD